MVYRPLVTSHFEPLSDFKAQLGESPVWAPLYDSVWWVDIVGQKLLRTHMDGATSVWDTPEMPGFVQVIGIDIFVGMETGIFQFDISSGQFVNRVRITLADQRFNDACTDKNGQIWAGTMDIENKKDNGVLFLFDPKTNSLAEKLIGFRTINGLAVDDSRQRLYVSDSHPLVQKVWTYSCGQHDDLHCKAEFASFNEYIGRPDGAGLDTQGNYWIAGVGGGQIFEFSPNGNLINELSVLPNSPTKLAFINSPNPAIVLSSFEDDRDGGRLFIWKNPELPAA